MTNKSIEYHSLKNLHFTLVKEQDKEKNSNYSCFFYLIIFLNPFYFFTQYTIRVTQLCFNKLLLYTNCNKILSKAISYRLNLDKLIRGKKWSIILIIMMIL